MKWVIFANKDMTETGMTSRERYDQDDSPVTRDSRCKKMPIVLEFIAPSYEVANNVYNDWLLR